MTTAGGRTWAIVLAAGRGDRFGSRKQFELIGRQTLVERAVVAVRARCDGVVVVAPAGAADVVAGTSQVTGGASRAASVRAGLVAVPADASVIVVHDAAHPLATAALVERVVAAVDAGADAVVPVVPVAETVARLDGAAVQEIVPRRELVLVQMPHAFRSDALRRAHAGLPEVSDEATLLHQQGRRVMTVAGEATNIHVTTPYELALAVAAARSAGDGDDSD